MPTQPPYWDEQRLEADRQLAIDQFRDERMSESITAYLEKFAYYRTAIERLLTITNDLADLAAQASAVLSDKDLLYTLRYLAGPPVSTDDLRVLADVQLTSAAVMDDSEEAVRVVETILRGLDHERFTWIAKKRAPRPGERRTAVIATAALIASQRVRTGRQTDAPHRQETLVKSQLTAAGFIEDQPRAIPTVFAAPDMGHFSGECVVGGSRKADVVVRLWDSRVMPIECKVSNSEINSIKRLTNDAAVKARIWIDDLGRNNVVPVAMLSGVFGLRHLIEAQERGLTLFWAHSLNELLSFIAATKE